MQRNATVMNKQGHSARRSGEVDVIGEDTNREFSSESHVTIIFSSKSSKI